MKSTIKEIEERFNNDVERFSNLDTGQQTTLDAVFNMELITQGITLNYPEEINLLDIGCGAGNYSVKLLTKKKDVNFTLVDLSQPMINRALKRVSEYKPLTAHSIKGDFRSIDLVDNSYDVIIATSVLHHLREDGDWHASFSKLYRLLKKGGSIWIFDLVFQEDSFVQNYMYKDLYGSYLSSLVDENYRDHVFNYIEKEDSPRSITFQLNLLQDVGFKKVDLLHKNLCFASFVAFK